MEERPTGKHPPTEPRVALVHDWLTGMRGGENVLEALATLFPDAPIYTLFHFPGSVSPTLEGRTIHTSFLQRAPGLRRHYRSYLPLFPIAIESFDLSTFNLILSSSHCVAKGIIPPPGTRHLCYCHTPMRYAWDQEHAYFPKRRGVAALVRRAILSRLRTWDTGTTARTDTFFANSAFVAERIRRYYGAAAEVLPPPVDVDYFTPAEGDPGDTAYALCVAALAPYKRIELAIQACSSMDLELRLVGTGPDRARLERLAGGNVRFLGRVERPELRQLYRGARCLVQPGIEDFGIASVEALACGTPVVAANQGGVLDIVEVPDHGVLFGVEEGAQGLMEAIDKCSRLRFNKLNLRRRAERFSESRFIARIQESIAQATAGEHFKGREGFVA